MSKNIANTALNQDVQQLGYDRSQLKSKIVHLGFGAFHRGHQALITHEMLAQEKSDWGIFEINLFGGEALITSLRAQDHQYSVSEMGASNTQVKVITSIVGSLHPELDGKEAVLSKMSEAQVAIVSLTITEKGYCVDLGSSTLDVENALIKADLKTPHAPSSAIGYIVEALRRRKEKNIKAFTVMSCDNVQENGALTKIAVLSFARLLDKNLGQWIEDNVSFPCTMVDRIVPAVTEQTLTQIESDLGVYDPCGIACEPFRQWIIEDNFVNGRPNWNLAGATFVENVIPFEEMKLRMLNGSHSFLAYLGYLGGYKHICDAMQNEAYEKATLALMLNEQAPTLNVPDGVDLEAYAHLLIARFKNPSLKHQTWQIAMDGSQKLPPRMIHSLCVHLKNKSAHKALILGIAAWMRYVSCVDENKISIDVKDPLLETFVGIYKERGLDKSVVKDLLAISSIFPRELLRDEAFVNDLTNAFQLLLTEGAKSAVASLEG
ncbi:D-mannonate oxidoreductase NAD-binding protein [Psychromonas sp. CNPT3]|uniref:mannitol dehydrogenase family protein n=1 Tax=Psychromonas sp. CNPT3 TaxID=314282 RepID=UPI00006EA47E|nr:fructuronate reductase [Psychromonas sp. CNPT3]AGH81321.1 D-mannonate oxidoreductase NAD-binding protein [Psychromonas sp. CNPT3]